MLNTKEIEKNLTTKIIGRKLIYMEETVSTNDDAKKQAEQGEAEGTVYLAEAQTRGRGRVFREWKTKAGESIAMSILIRPHIKPSEAPTITPVLAVSAIEAIRELTGLEVRIKWPNDIFLEKKKIGGILTEMNAGMDEVKYIVAGIGLNVNQAAMEDELINIAASLKMFSGNTYDRDIIVAKLLNRFEDNYEHFKKHGLSYFGKALKEYSAIIGKEVIVISGLEMIEGTAEDLDDLGNLILRLEDGRAKTIIYGDVSLKCKELLKE